MSGGVVKRMLHRITQPDVNPALRDPERHGFWPGFLVAWCGVALVLAGAWRVTSIETTEGGLAREPQLIKAFANGGLRFPPKPRVLAVPALNADQPIATAEALEQWRRQQREPSTPWRVRVDPEASTPCPT